MATRIEANESEKRLSEYMARAAQHGERILVMDHGKPVAALVSVDDLHRLEAMAAAESEEDPEAARQARYRRLMEEAGLITQWPSGDPVPLRDYQPIEIEGPPLSEQIIADRR